MDRGTRLGRYEILAALGRGGMGEVYRARDTSVGRDIALKLLPTDVAADPNRLQRLRREARLLASLNHPHIAALYALEEEQGVPFLVLELVEGQTLAARLREGRMPPEVAVPLAIQMAEALAAAHARGVVHRDLKPANVMITAQGLVKLLDFGIARRGAVADTAADTVSRDPLTAPHQFLGTPAYMSPEQINGSSVTPQSDIWAFGCVLYESLTGKHPFPANTGSDRMAVILERDPDWTVLAGCPAKVRDVVKRCLQKDPAQRIHHIADARIELQEAMRETPEVLPAVAKGRTQAWMAAAVASLVLAAVALGLLAWTRDVPAPAEPVRRFGIDLGRKLAFGPDYPAAVAISPDGALIAYVGEVDGDRRIYVRSMDDVTARPLDGTVGAQQPFFSPDAKWLGFFADGKLKKISVRGGAPVVLAPAPNGTGGAWSSEGWIVFAPTNPSALRRVSADGSDERVFSQVRTGAGEHAHWSPAFLPDQRTVVFTVYMGRRNTDSRLAVQGSGDTEHRTLVEGGSHGRFVAPGWLVYGRGTELVAAEFDPAAGAVTGTPFRVLEGVQDTPLGAPIFALSDQGTLVYAPAVTVGHTGRIVWLDRTGRVREELDAGTPAYRPRMSPDGSRVAFHQADPDFNVWVKDPGRGARVKLSKDPAYDGFPVWSPDGRQVAFSSAREGSRTLFVQRTDGSDAAERLLSVGHPRWPTSWSPDGNWLAYNEEDPQTGSHVWLLDMRTRQPRRFRPAGGRDGWARFSPDGTWLAYHSDESGSFEVYVCAVQDPRRPLQVSAGGMGPLWSPAGGEIYYNRGTQFMAVPVRLGQASVAARPQVLFTTGMLVNDVGARGERFLAADAPVTAAISRLDIVLGWRHVLTRLNDGR